MYSTPAALIDRFRAVEISQLADRSDTGVVSVVLIEDAAHGEDLSAYTAEEQAAAAQALAVIQGALDTSGALINAHLQPHYVLPPPEVPAILPLIEQDLARAQLMLDQQAGQIPEAIERQRKVWMDFLKAVSTDSIQLGISRLSQAPAATRGGPRASASGRVFTPDTLGDY